MITFMFHQLQGSSRKVREEMEAEVCSAYAKVLTRVVRKPASPVADGRRPIWIVAPDYPVPKHQKMSLRDVTINHGRHMQGVALLPPCSRLQVGLDRHWKEEQGLYVRPPSRLQRVHAKPIVERPAYVTRYCLKSITRGRATWDEVLILPRALSELNRSNRSAQS